MEIKKNCHTIIWITGYVPDEIGEYFLYYKETVYRS